MIVIRTIEARPRAWPMSDFQMEEYGILIQILKLYKCRKCYRTERFDRNNKFPCNTTAVQQHEKNVRRRVDILAGTGSHLY